MGGWKNVEQQPRNQKSPSPSQQRKQQPKELSPSQQKQQKKESVFQRTVVVWWRKFHHWFKTVFIVRKEYVPGDTCRFVWQTVPEIKQSFVYYRVGHLVGNVFVFVVSLFHVLIPYQKNLCENEPVVLCFGPFRLQFEWFFYATSCGIMFNLIQSIWALVLTLQLYLRQQRERQQNVEPVEAVATVPEVKRLQSKSKDSVLPPSTSDIVPVPKSASNEHKIMTRTGFYWGLHSYSMSASVLIDIVYWTLVWPKTGRNVSSRLFNQLNEHGFNLPLMIGDYCVVAFPVILNHVLFTILISTFYLFVSYIYYVSGGKNDDRTEVYLYAFLNWEKPGTALKYGFCIGFLTSIILLIFLFIDYYKFKIRPQTLLSKTQKPTQHL